MKKILIPLIALALFLWFPFCYLKAEGGNEEFKVNNEFMCKRLKIEKNTFILDYKFEDVNGDNEKDNIILIGNKFNKYNTSLIQNIKVIIRNGKTKKYYPISVGKFNSGYNARLFLGDFDGDCINDVLVTIGNGKGSYYSLFSFKGNKSINLIDEDVFFKGLSYNINFINNYKVRIINKNLNSSYILDVGNKKGTYINIGIYDSNGKLAKKNAGSFDNISSLVPIDEDKNGVFEIKSIQTIWGVSSSDTLGYGKALWKYSGKKMQMQSYEFLEFATPGTKDKLQRVIPVLAPQSSVNGE
jgi:hypothetical protein